MRIPLSIFRRAAADPLFRNSVFIVLTTGVTGATGYAYWLVIARTYDPAELGVATAIISAMLLTSILSQMGMTTRLIARLKDSRSNADWMLALNAAMLIGAAGGLALGTVVLAIIGFSVEQLSVLTSAEYTFLFLTGVVLWTMGTVLDYSFIAERTAGHMLARGTVFGVGKIPIVLIAAAILEQNGVGILGSWVAGTALSCLFSLTVSLRLIGRPWRWTGAAVIDEARTMSRGLFGHHITNVGAMLPVFLLPILVVERLSATDNAFFYVSWMLGSVFFMFSSAVGQSLLAEGSRAPAQIATQVRKSSLILIGILSPVVAVYVLAGRDLLALFGSEYPAAGGTLLLLLTVAALPDAVTGLYGNVLRVTGRLHFSALMYVGISIIALGLSWIWLPSMGIEATGWAWLTAQLFGTSMAAIHLTARWLGRRANQRKTARSRAVGHV